MHPTFPGLVATGAELSEGQLDEAAGRVVLAAWWLYSLFHDDALDPYSV